MIRETYFSIRVCCIIIGFLIVFLNIVNAQERGVKINSSSNPDNVPVPSYDKSCALLIGASDYTGGWPKLPSVIEETQKVGEVLKSMGFYIQTVYNPDNTELKEAFENFVKQWGYDSKNRLFFFFSGHGWSRKGGEHGYLVPCDAPDPRNNEKAFLRKSLSMTQILTWCKEMEANHVIFIFDSCFGGTVFKSKSLPQIPPHITALTIRPVRQFITAGDAGEEVPSKSVFAACLVRALEGEADLSRDGFITGTELGMYLHDKVIYYKTGQTPQYGKMRDPDFDAGDFVFFVPKPSEPQRTVIKQDTPALTTTTYRNMFSKNEIAIYQNKRLAMVEDLRENKGFNDPLILRAFSRVPMELFCPAEFRHLVYQDAPVPVGYDETISQPFVSAIMILAARISSDSKVLELKTGSGYQTALISELVSSVFTVESTPELANLAEKNFIAGGYINIQLKRGDSRKGWAEKAPFDAIIATAAFEQIPNNILYQLKIGGRFVGPIGIYEKEGDSQELLIIERTNDGFVKRSIMSVRFSMLP